MSIAFTFPGQGSQAVGMGKDLADAFPEARAVFQEVDDALGEKLSQVMWEGPEETLTLTANAQPALMAVSLATLRALEARGFSVKDKVSYVAGHSLGEYSALAAAGTFSIADTARLLRIRGNAMQAAVPVGEGAMAAVLGLEQADVEASCAEAARQSPCQIANDNGGGQLVISGAKAGVELAGQLCTTKGAKRVDHAAGLRAFPFGAHGAGGGSHAQGAGGRDEKPTDRAGGRQCGGAAADRRRGDYRAPGRAGDRPCALARDGGVVWPERRDDAL